MSSSGIRPRLAIVTSHPIQYYAPWFRHITRCAPLDLRVFYLFDPSVGTLFDQGFQRDVKWDVPLLEGYAYEFVPNTSKSPGTSRFGGLRNPTLKRQIDAFQPDAVLLIGYNYASLLRFVFTRRAVDAPLIFRGDSHRLGRECSWRESLKRMLIAAIFDRFKAFLFVGQANFRYFTYHGISSGALFHAPHAVDMARFQADGPSVAAAAQAWRRSLGIAEEHAVVLFAGKFEEKKRPLDLLRAFKRVAPGKNAALLFVGDGPLKHALMAEAKGISNVHFAPFQNQSLMPRTYAACDLFVLPSYGSFETWGLAINEAMCLGKPVIVSSHVGCAENLVVPGVTGLVFTAGSEEALASALATALDDRQRLPAWGAAARQKVAEFSYAAATQGLLAAIAHVAPCTSIQSTPSQA